MRHGRRLGLVRTPRLVFRMTHAGTGDVCFTFLKIRILREDDLCEPTRAGPPELFLNEWDPGRSVRAGPAASGKARVPRPAGVSLVPESFRRQAARRRKVWFINYG